MLKKISLRLGMEDGPYLGFFLGSFIASMIILCMILLIPLAVATIGILAASLILVSVLGAGIVLCLRNRRRSSPDMLCTCRYRSSWHTVCRECALRERE